MAVTFEFTGPIGISDKLMRARLASREGQPDVWELAKMAIDHAAFILVTASELRPEHRILDLVLATQLRRAIVTAEAIRVLIEAGLEEPSLTEFRTLLDIELSTRLIVSDDTGRMARRFAAYHCLSAKRQGTRILQHPETRRILLGGEEYLASTKEWTKRWAGYLRDPVFDDVRRQWPGTEIGTAMRAWRQRSPRSAQMEIIECCMKYSHPLCMQATPSLTSTVCLMTVRQ